MPWYMVFIVLAFLFYSWAVWGAYIERELCPFFVVVFLAGFLFDLVGTSPMIGQTTQLSFHAVLGVMALVVMGLHGVWACLVNRQTVTNRRHLVTHQKPTTASRLFHTWSPWAYAFWILTFISGGVLRYLGR